MASRLIIEQEPLKVGQVRKVTSNNGEKIDVEYDGWYWHKDTEERDKKRNYKVLNLGYKILRIKSKFLLPTEGQIKLAVEYLTNENHHYTEIVLDI